MSLRLRTPEDLSKDAQTHLMTGRLIGAAEMTARYLQIHGDEHGKEIGTRLDEILRFFFIGHSTSLAKKED